MSYLPPNASTKRRGRTHPRHGFATEPRTSAGPPVRLSAWLDSSLALLGSGMHRTGICGALGLSRDHLRSSHRGSAFPLALSAGVRRGGYPVSGLRSRAAPPCLSWTDFLRSGPKAQTAGPTARPRGLRWAIGSAATKMPCCVGSWTGSTWLPEPIGFRRAHDLLVAV
jgi:hypothetical protein